MPRSGYRTSRQRSLNVRRLLGACVAMAMLWGLFWLVFVSGLADPFVEVLRPGYESLIAMINEPLGIDWGGSLVTIAAIFIPPLLLLLFIFDQNP